MTEGGTGATPLTPEEEESVARLLAEAGGPVRMPAEVAARLEDVLGELESERAGGATADESARGVDELRARRRWPRVLLAAAAVVVGGYAVGTVATQGTLSGSDSAMSGASDSAGGSAGGSVQADSEDQDGDGRVKDQAAPESAEAPGQAPADESGAGSLDGMTLSTRGATVRLRSDRLETGVLRALRVLEETPRAALERSAPDEATCAAPGLDEREQSLLVRYDGADAVLVAGPERGGTVDVTVYDCAGSELVSTLVRP